jgi:hypothetical protein
VSMPDSDSYRHIFTVFVNIRSVWRRASRSHSRLNRSNITRRSYRSRPFSAGRLSRNQRCHSSGNTVLNLPADTGVLSLIGFHMARSIAISWASLTTSISKRDATCWVVVTAAKLDVGLCEDTLEEKATKSFGIHSVNHIGRSAIMQISGLFFLT